MKNPSPYPVAGRRGLPCPRTLLLLSFLGGVCLTPGLAANLTLTKTFLDSVNGFVNFAKPTLGSGANAITNTLQPGDTVYIEGHTRPLLILVNLTQGTAANPITVTNLGGQFIIDYPDPEPTGGTGIKLWGMQHVVFKGTPSPGNYDYGIKVNRAGSVGLKVEYNNYQQGRVGGAFADTIDLEITNVEICNVGFAGIQAKYEAASSSLPPTALLDGLHIHHNYIHDTIGGEGMYIGWTSDGHPDVANVSIHDNLIERTGWDGMQLNRSRGMNAIYNNYILGYGINSITYDNPPAQYYFWQSAGIAVSRTTGLSIHNNWTQVGNQYSAGGLSLFVADTTKVYNNVFVAGDLGARDPQSAVYVSTSPTVVAGATVSLLNNTIVEPDNHGIQFAGSYNVPTTITNNLIARPIHGTFIVNPTSSTPTLQSYVHASTLAGAGLVDAANGNFHLAAGSPAIDTGTNVSSSGVTSDFDGQPRPQGGGYDIGAFEHLPVNVLSVAGAGTALGSQFCAATGAFDAPPTWDSVNQKPLGNDPGTGDTTTAYANRHFYIDFGPNWAKVRITGMWTRYRPWSGGSYAGFATMWWDSNNDNVNSGTTAPTLNFGTAQGVPHINAQQWFRDRDFSSAPVTPLGRYLIVSTGPAPSNRPNEFVFVGYTVP